MTRLILIYLAHIFVLIEGNVIFSKAGLALKLHKNVTGESVKYRGNGWVTDHETEQSNKKSFFFRIY